MSQKTPTDSRQTISAMVDGEASEWELRKVLQQSKDKDSIREEWATYQTLGAILRNEENRSTDSLVDISGSIMSEIEGEQAYSKTGYFKRTLSQTAIAASVAVVALVGIQQYQVAQNDTGAAGTLADTTVQDESGAAVYPPAGFDFQPLTREVSTSPAAVQRQSTQVQIPVDSEQLELHLNELLQEHSNNSVNAAQDALPMVRVPAGTDVE